ncbi:MAG: hypothetical protein RSG77_24665, partial [Hafnia sp.]
PAVETIGKGVAFTQTASDCKLDQTRTRAESYRDHRNGSNIPVARANENRVLNNQAGSRGAVGTLEEWQATTPTYTAWIDTNSQYGCSTWLPLPSSKTTTATFAQTAADCKTDQTRNRQDREKEKNTGAIRDKGVPVVENQVLNAQVATRSYTVTLGAWTNNGAKYACTNWSPAPSTVTINQSFTQTATDCKQNQTRTRAESYVDHKSGSNVAVSVPAEAQTLAGQTNTQTAVGTKETWVAIAPTYTAWANSSGVYNCNGSWAPSPSNYNVATQFTQTTYSCSINQSRIRQDREQETTTQVVRNKGAAVTEAQTVGGQYNARTYLQDYSGWSWVGGFYSCGGWSPDPSTVNSGVAFTQTQYCYRNQQRGAAGYTWNGSNWVADPANPYRVETVAYSGQPNYQTAYGTKVTTECRYGPNDNWSHIFNYSTGVYWDGQTLFDNAWSGAVGYYTSMNIGGYRYYRGNPSTDWPGTMWQVCRTPL